MNLLVRLLKINRIGILFLTSIIFSACTITTGDIDPTHEILEAPVLRFENNQILWEESPNAGSYRLQGALGFLEGNQTSPFNIDSSLQNGVYSIMALPSNYDTHVASIIDRYSQKIRVEYVEPTKIDTPVLELSSNVLKWESIANAESYQVYKNGNPIVVLSENLYEISGDDANGIYTIKAIPLVEERLLAASELSAELSVVYITPAKLGMATLVFTANEITWADVPNADTYQLIKDGVPLENTNISPYMITSSDQNGAYEVVAKSSAQPLVYFNSDNSNKIDVVFDDTL